MARSANEDVAVFPIGDLLSGLTGQFGVLRAGVRLAGDGARACQRLVGEREVEVPDAVRLTQVQAASRMVQRWLGAADRGVHARHLPLAARKVHRRSDLTPVVARGVGCVQHRVVVLRDAVCAFEQRPDPVEEVGGQPPVDRRVIGAHTATSRLDATVHDSGPRTTRYHSSHYA